MNGDYRWSNSLGIEVGYVDFGKYTASNCNYVLGNYNLDAKLSGFTLGVNGKANFTPSWFFSCRGGLFISQMDVSGQTTYYKNVSINSTDTGLYAGLGIGCNITPNVAANANFDTYKAKSDSGNIGNSMFSGKLEYQF